jgi:hypothetical protein
MEYGISKQESSLLVEKWDKKGYKVSEIPDDHTARTMAVVLENQANELTNEASSTLSGDIGEFKKIVMPLVRRIWPSLITNDLVAVQPMTGPVGLAYAVRNKYSNTSGGATAGDELGHDNLYPAYSGDTTASPLSGASGLGTSAGETLDSINPTETGDINEVQFGIETTTITAVTRKLKARWSLEAEQDVKAMHGLDIETEMISMIQYEISAEIDREVINKMHKLCDDNARTTSVTVSALDGQWEVEKFRNLYTRILQAANEIGTDTRRGAGNFVIVSPKVATALDTIGNFIISPVGVTPFDFNPGVVKKGSIEGRIDVYVDNFAVTEFALVGYKGNGASDAGLIYSPYVPIMMQKTMEPGAFYPIIGMMSRYALTDNLYGAFNYYKRVDVDFSGMNF